MPGTGNPRKKATKKERDFQSQAIQHLGRVFAGCIILKSDSGYVQGIPDYLILCGNKWAALEFKNDEDADFQPNQKYYVDKMNKMSYAAIIHPGNKDQVFDDLQRAFGTKRKPRVPGA